MRGSLPMKEPALPCPVWGMEGSGMTMREMQDIPSVVRPVANCLAVWTDSDLGHVGYVDYVNSNGTMHVLEGGRTDCLGTGGIGEITISSTVGSTRSGGTQTLKGFVYLGNAPKWYSSMTPVNIGDDVYAHLIKNSTWNTWAAVD